MLAATVTATGARASLFLTFSGTQAAPGDIVIVQSGGSGALRNIRAVRFFLAAADEADEITSPTDARLVPLGRMRIGEDGNGYLRFVVPDIPAGDYKALLCGYCTNASDSRWLHPAGPFPGSFVVLGNGGGLPLLTVVLTAGGVFALVSTARRRRWSRSLLRA